MSHFPRLQTKRARAPSDCIVVFEIIRTHRCRKEISPEIIRIHLKGRTRTNYCVLHTYTI